MTSARKGKTKGWSYSAGERGVNRVRAYEHPTTGRMFCTVYESDRTGESRRPKRIALGHSDRERAKGQAEEMAAKLRQAVPVRPAHLTLAEMFDNYLREVTPQKVESTQRHDRNCAQLFLRAFGAQSEPRHLSRREWDRFIRDRRDGRLRPKGRVKPGAVRNRIIAYDLKWLLAVLRWATQTSDGQGGPLLDRNPLVGLEMPREDAPLRGILSDAEYQAMTKVALEIHPDFERALILVHETGHRLNSVRQLRWSDIDLAKGMIHWLAAHDKIGYEHDTPISPTLQTYLVRERKKQPFGDGWLFPEPIAPDRPRRRELFSTWWDRAERLAEVPHVKGRQWHSLRRKFASELKHRPLKDLCQLGGWKEPTTVLTCYIKADEATMREALAERTPLREAASS